MAITGYITRSEGHPCHERITELPELSHTDWLAFDIETTGLDHIIHTVVAVSIWDGINAYVIDVRDLDADLVGAWIRDCYSRLVVGHNVGFDLRFLEQSYGVGYPKEVYDTMIAERLLTAGKWKKPNGEHEWRTSLAAVLERRYGISLDKSLQTSFGGDGAFSPEQLAYATEDITHLSYLCDQQQIELEEFKLDNVAEIEMSCVPIFAEMDRIGVTIHEPKLRKLIADKTLERDLLRDQIQGVLTPLLEWPRMEAKKGMEQALADWSAAYEQAKQEAEEEWELWASNGMPVFPDFGTTPPDWLPEWLDASIDKNDGKPKGLKRFVRYRLSTNPGQFRNLHPRPPKPTEDTEPINPQSDKQMIEAFRAWGVELPDYRGKTLAIVQLETDRDEVRACIAQILDYKRAQKLLDAFGESLLQKIGLDGRLRGNNNQIGTATGRPSGYDPNLYQMPRMRVYREIFIPAEGMLFVICDYSQMEMRIVAELSGDHNLAAAFSTGLDIHTYTAQLMFNTQEPTKDQRHTAKTINFGILYGMGPKKMRTELAAKGVFMTLEEAYAAVNLWKASYPDAYRWIQEQGRLATTQGFTQTPFGRRRWFDLNFANDQDKWGAARAGANHPIQGSNADATKLAMVLINQCLAPLGASIVLQVYDEVVVEVPRLLASYARDVVESCMLIAGQQILKTVPCAVDAVVSTSWAEEDAIEIP